MTDVEPNMVNRLAGIQRDNIRQLFKRHELSLVDVGRLTVLSEQTVRNTFNETPRTAPSKKTLEAIYGLFTGLTEDCFDVYNSVENLETKVVERQPVPKKATAIVEETLPVVIKLKNIRLQIDRTVIESEVSEALAKKLVDLLIYGEEEL